jgi:hypothetical protein
LDVFRRSAGTAIYVFVATGKGVHRSARALLLWIPEPACAYRVIGGMLMAVAGCAIDPSALSGEAVRHGTRVIVLRLSQITGLARAVPAVLATHTFRATHALASAGKILRRSVDHYRIAAGVAAILVVAWVVPVIATSMRSCTDVACRWPTDAEQLKAADPLTAEALLNEILAEDDVTIHEVHYYGPTELLACENGACAPQNEVEARGGSPIDLGDIVDRAVHLGCRSSQGEDGEGPC